MSFSGLKVKYFQFCFFIIYGELVSISHFNICNSLSFASVVPLELIVVDPWILVIPSSVLALIIVVIPFMEVGVSIV